MYASRIHSDGSEGSFDNEGHMRHPSIVDFGSVALYVPALQTVVAVCICCVSSIGTSVIGSALDAPSGVRTATLASLIGLCCVWKPVHVGPARGVDVMFDALRPAVIVYMSALIFEQLVHSCGPERTATVARASVAMSR